MVRRVFKKKKVKQKEKEKTGKKTGGDLRFFIFFSTEGQRQRPP